MKEKIWNKNFIMACLICLFVGFALSMTNSTMARHVYNLFGSAAFTGYMNAGFAIMAIIARLIAGDLSDRRGRRVVMIMGAAIFAVSVFGFGVFPFAALLIIFRSLQGFGYAVCTTANYAAGADVLPEDRMSEGVGYMSAVYSITTALGSAIALALMDASGSYIPVAGVATAFIVIGIVLALFLKYEKQPFYIEKMARQKSASAAKDLSEYKGIARVLEKNAVPGTLVQLFSCTAWAAINSFIVLYADSRGISNVALFFTVTAAAMLVSRVFSGRLTDKFGELPAMVPALILNMLGYFLLMKSDTVSGIYAAGFIIGFGSGIVSPACQAAAVKYSPVNRRGAANGTYNLSNDIANGVGAVVWGIVIDALGYPAMFIGCVICCAVALALAIFFFRKKQLAKQLGKL
jgi:MFS family permease